MSAVVPDELELLALLNVAQSEPKLLTLQIQVCENCVNRVAGECHMPGCFYWMHSVEQVPEYLSVYVVRDGAVK